MEIRAGGGRRIDIWLICFCLILLFPAVAFAEETITINNTTLTFDRIIYVDAVNGDDTTGDGTENNPYATLQKAVDACSSSGDAIKLSGHRHDNTSGFTFPAKEITILGVPGSSELDFGTNIVDGTHGGVLNLYQLIITYGNRFLNYRDHQVNAYNCVFRTQTNSNYGYFLYRGTGGGGSIIHYLENCTIYSRSSSGGNQVIIGGCNIELRNCYYKDYNDGTNRYPHNYTVKTCIIRDTFVTSSTALNMGTPGAPAVDDGNTYQLTDTAGNWQNSGTGTNPDGSQAHIGVYGGEFAWSPPLPPAAPTGLNATAVSYNQVQLTWDPNSEDNLAGYIVFRDDVEIARVGNDTTSYTDNDVQPNTSYTYRISAYNTFGAEGDMSEPVTVTTPEIPKPVLTASVDNRNINLSWTGAADEFLVIVNGQQVAETTEKQYTYTAEPGSYELQVIAVVGTEQFASDPVNVTVSRIATPGAAKMAGDLMENMGLVIAPLGGLLALALALKASPALIAIAKASMFRRFF